MLELLTLRSRRSFLGTRQGGHLSPKRGHGIEFSDYRQYELGDNPRHIDWGVFARSDRLYVKRFQEEQELSVLILIDTSSSVMVPENQAKWFRARDIAFSLSYIALMQHDRLSLVAPSIAQIGPVSGPRAVHTISAALEGAPNRSSPNFIEAAKFAAARMRFPGVAVVISDFLLPNAELRSLFDVLRAKNLDITAIQVVGAEDIAPLPAVPSGLVLDSETGEELFIDLSPEARERYAAIRAQHQLLLQTYLQENRITFATQLPEFLTKHLTMTGLVQ